MPVTELVIVNPPVRSKKKMAKKSTSKKTPRRNAKGRFVKGSGKTHKTKTTASGSPKPRRRRRRKSTTTAASPAKRTTRRKSPARSTAKKTTKRRKSGGRTVATYSLVKHNSPMDTAIGAMKTGGIIYAVMLATRVIVGVIKDKVIGKAGVNGLLKNVTPAKESENFLYKAAPYTPALLGVLTTILAPRLIKKEKTAGMLQLAGALVAYENILQNAVIPRLTMKDGKAIVADTTTGKLPLGATIGKYLGLAGDEGVSGYYQQRQITMPPIGDIPEPLRLAAEQARQARMVDESGQDVADRVAELANAQSARRRGLVIA